MVRIPNEIKEFIEKQGIFAVGTTGANNLPNVSPRIFFRIDEDVIYWLDFFKHKSHRNFKTNPWVTLAVFNKEDLRGFQFRGIVSFITDESIKAEIKDSIIKKILEKNSSEKVKKLSEKKDVDVIRFEPKVGYSLNPEEFSDMCIGSDVDSTNLFQK